MSWIHRLLSSAALGLAKFALLSMLAYFGFSSEWFRPYWLSFRATPVLVQFIVWGASFL